MENEFYEFFFFSSFLLIINMIVMFPKAFYFVKKWLIFTKIKMVNLIVF